MPQPQGHAIGFVDTRRECHAIVGAWNSAGVPDAVITVLWGDDGLHLLKRMMSDSLWGEAAEDVLTQGIIELSHGHFVIAVETKDRAQAMVVANLSVKHGGHCFNHFGCLTDERLTR